MSSISVLMSVYKADKPEYFYRAIQSVWTDQSLKPDEIILIEDGPLTPQLHLVIDEWKNKGVVFNIIVNDENIGLTKSLNKGIALSSCDYIARMDSDDISMPDRFKLQADFLDGNQDVAVVGGSIQEFDANNVNLGVRIYPRDNDAALRYIHKASPVAHPAVMMRSSIFKSGIKYNETFRTSQDIALWYDLLCKGYKIANLQEIVIMFRRDDDLFSRRSRNKAFNELKIYCNGIRRIHGFSLLYIYPFARFIFRLLPVRVIKSIYSSKIRHLFLSK